MMERHNSYPANLTDLLASTYPQNDHLINESNEKYAEINDNYENERLENGRSPSLDENDSNQSSYGVDLTGKGTHLAGKSFTIAAILGLSNVEEDVMNLSVQERLQGQRHLQNYLYANHHDMQRLNADYCRGVAMPPSLRQDSPRPDLRPQVTLKNRNHQLQCPNSSGRSKRIRTIFTPEQLERLEAEFERQQYMVGPERLYLAHALQLTEAQVKVWFQNRRIKWRKHHLEVTQQRLAVLQRHRTEERDDEL